MVKHRKKATELERAAYHEAGHVVMAYILIKEHTEKVYTHYDKTV